MKKLYIVANWKSYKTVFEVKTWFEEVSKHKSEISNEQEIIVCAPFVFLSNMNTIIKNEALPIKLGAQNISRFGEGAYTGEIFAKQAADFVTYAIVGHSERRKYFHETNDDVLAKVEHLIENNIIPILCISDMEQMD